MLALALPMPEQLLEIVVDLRHFQDSRELAHPAANALDIEVRIRLDDVFDVHDIASPPGDGFHDDDVLG